MFFYSLKFLQIKIYIVPATNLNDKKQMEGGGVAGVGSCDVAANVVVVVDVAIPTSYKMTV